MNTFYILKTLKAELKRSKITYKDLSQELKMSEAGVKKIFSKDDLSMKRAFEICKAMNISFSEVVSQTENSKELELRFTDAQVTFLKKHTNYFYFYMKLAYEQKTPLQIQQEYALSYKSLNTYLKKLEELNLIKRHPKDRAQIVGGTPLAVSTGGTELENIKYEIIKDLLAQVSQTKKGEILGGGLYLTQDESEDVKSKLKELIGAYSLISSRNRKNTKSNASPLSIMMVMSPTSMFNKLSDI
jgi:transcriptional regulator with XRE-family HTH domain